MLTSLFHVALGGAIGASGRYLVNQCALRLMGAGFPWGTLLVNVIGSVLMGVLVVILANKDATRLAPLLMTGLLGGFTTFSAFSLDAVSMYERGQMGLAALYVCASVILSLAGLVAGMMLTRGAFQ